MDEGVGGRVGGMGCSVCLAPKPPCAFAIEEAVGIPYRAQDFGALTGGSGALAWLTSMREDNDALRASLREAGGTGGFRPLCDFWPRKLPGLDMRGAEEDCFWVPRELKLDWLRGGGCSGGDGDSRSFWNWRTDDGGGAVGDLALSLLNREGGRNEVDGGRCGGAL